MIRNCAELASLPGGVGENSTLLAKRTRAFDPSLGLTFASRRFVLFLDCPDLSDVSCWKEADACASYLDDWEVASL